MQTKMAARKNPVNSPPMATSSDDNDFVSPPPKRHRGEQGEDPCNPAPQMDTVAHETTIGPKQVYMSFYTVAYFHVLTAQFLFGIVTMQPHLVQQFGSPITMMVSY
jgi:hypothetical protein